MGRHVLAPEKVRSERTARGFLAMFLVMGVLAAITITGSGIASAGNFTGFFAPRIAYGGVDFNNDGLVNETDTSDDFMGLTDLIDGHLDCDAWTDVNTFTDGDNGIDEDDDCVLVGYAISTGLVSAETYIHVVDGYFAFTSLTETGSKSLITNGFRMPAVYWDGEASFDYASATSYQGADFAWHLVSGKVDVDFDGTANDNATDYMPPYDTTHDGDIVSGVVDLDGDGGAADSLDTCSNDCFFGQDVTLGLVQNNTPSNPYEGVAGEDGEDGADGVDGVSGRTTVVASSSTNSLNKSKSAMCSSTTKPLGGGYVLVGSASTLAHLTVVANGPITGGWRVRVIEATPTTGTWSVDVTAVCAIA